MAGTTNPNSTQAKQTSLKFKRGSPITVSKIQSINVKHIIILRICNTFKKKLSFFKLRLVVISVEECCTLPPRDGKKKKENQQGGTVLYIKQIKSNFKQQKFNHYQLDIEYEQSL